MALHDLTEPLTAAVPRHDAWPVLPAGGAAAVGATPVGATAVGGATAARATLVDAAADDPLDTPLRLPDPPAPPRRGALPLVASAVPVIGALVLWAVTGTVMMLWFAALGPAIAAASLVDGARAARSARRRGAHEAAGARRRVAAVVQARHERERRHAWARHPDVLALTGTGARPDGVWRAGRREGLVVGHGAVRSAVRVDGGGDDPAARELARAAAVLDDAPVVVPADAGIAVCGPEPLACAVVRALALQACLTMPPDVLRLAPGAAAYSEDWAGALPHARQGACALRLALWETGVPLPGRDVGIARVGPGRVPPPGGAGGCRCPAATS
ncbi:hypothetical protein [Microbacterium sp.]|uniref:hypothetical protein n=1 Tax=Microbacterium sp. TaxID=51671 RepID=UPI003A9283A1